MAKKILNRSAAPTEPTPAQLAVQQAIGNLSWIGAMLQAIEDQKGGFPGGLPPDEFAFFIRAGLEARLGHLERVLVAAGALPVGLNLFGDTSDVLPEARHA